MATGQSQEEASSPRSRLASTPSGASSRTEVLVRCDGTILERAALYPCLCSSTIANNLGMRKFRRLVLGFANKVTQPFAQKELHIAKTKFCDVRLNFQHVFMICTIIPVAFPTCWKGTLKRPKLLGRRMCRFFFFFARMCLPRDAIEVENERIRLQREKQIENVLQPQVQRCFHILKNYDPPIGFRALLSQVRGKAHRSAAPSRPRRQLPSTRPPPTSAVFGGQLRRCVQILSIFKLKMQNTSKTP